METVQDQERDAEIESLLADLSTTDDSAEAAKKARQLRILVNGGGTVKIAGFSASGSILLSHTQPVNLTAEQREKISSGLAQVKPHMRWWWLTTLLNLGFAGFLGATWEHKNWLLIILCVFVLLAVLIYELRGEWKFLKLKQMVEEVPDLAAHMRK